MMERSLVALSLLIVIVALSSPGAAHARVTVLHTFAGSDGANPDASLVEDAAGDLYGTTLSGGTDCSGFGCGTLFKLAPDGTETVLYAFTGGRDGAGPTGGLVRDKTGNFYGATEDGGTGGGCGTVFMVAPDGTESLLHTFTGGSDGCYPAGGVIRDRAGNLYGTTTSGGSSTGCQFLGCGTIFKVTPNGAETVLYAFKSGNDGAYPAAGLIRDKAGNLYGTTQIGGGSCDCGTVFEVASDGSEMVLHAFTSGSDGEAPNASLIEDKAGNLYGTTSYGGSGWGTVFKLAVDGTETVLYAFAGGSDGALPVAGLVEDGGGNLYGTTSEGGAAGIGTVFKLAVDGTETVLYGFTGSRGAYPSSGLIKDSTGKLYGTASMGGGTGCGGYGCGTVFRIRK